MEEIIEALLTDDDTIRISAICCSFTVGDLKQMIINAMTKQYEILENYDGHRKYQLKDWQVNDVKKTHFKEWLKEYK